MLPAAQRLTLKDFPYAMAQTAEETAQRSLRARQRFLTAFFYWGMLQTSFWVYSIKPKGLFLFFCVKSDFFDLLSSFVNDSRNKCVVYINLDLTNSK